MCARMVLGISSSTVCLIGNQLHGIQVSEPFADESQYEASYSVKGDRMQVAETFTAHACTVHNRVFVTSLNTWLSLNHPQVSMVFEDATFLEAACDYCLLIARSLFEQQFPRLYRASIPVQPSRLSS